MQKGVISITLASSTLCSGENLTGEVTLAVPKACMFFGVQLTMTGKEITQLEKRVQTTTYTNPPPNHPPSQFASVPGTTTAAPPGPQPVTHTQVHNVSSKDKFLNYTEILIPYGMQIGHNPIEIAPGTYKMPFNFALPRDLPASFKHPNCTIDYHLHAKLNTKSSGFFDGAKSLLGQMFGMNATKVCFTVTGGYPIDKVNLHSKPMVIRDEKGFLMSRTRGKLSASVHLSRSWGSPDGTLSIPLVIANDSNKVVKSVEIGLIRRLHIKADTESKTEIEPVLCKVVPVNIQKKTPQTDLTVEYLFPKTLMPSYHGKYVDVSYIFKADFVPSGLTIRLSITLEDFLIVNEAAAPFAHAPVIHQVVPVQYIIQPVVQIPVQAPLYQPAPVTTPYVVNQPQQINLHKV